DRRARCEEAVVFSLPRRRLGAGGPEGQRAAQRVCGRVRRLLLFPHLRLRGARGAHRAWIERNTPWWTGVIGVSRVKSWAKSLADEIEDEIEHQHGRVYGRQEF